MKTKLRLQPSALSLKRFLFALVLCLAALPGRAQNDTVTISATEFQRMVYSAHLLTQMAEKPELDASLQVLLELQRRNPNANPAALAGVLTTALQRYRTNAPACIRTNGYRDEVLAAYLEALRQVPARTNFVPATLQFLNHFMLRPDDYTNASPAELIHSGNQRLLSSQSEPAQRNLLLSTCTTRAQGNAAFAAALDGLLLPETLVCVADTPAQIIGNPNSALHDNLTMQTLLGLSAASGNASLTVSTNLLMTLFAAEKQALWDTIHTNLALRLEINQSQPDLLAYLTNQAAMDANAQREALVKQGQTRRIACANAAILVQSKLVEAKDPLIKLPGEMEAVGGIMANIAGGLSTMSSGDAGKFTKVMASGNLLVAGVQIFNLLSGAESPEEETLREIGNIRTLIGDLSTNMNLRFDRVDQSLTEILDTLDTQFAKIDFQLGTVQGGVDAARKSLVDVQADLHRLERHLLSYLAELDSRGLKTDLNLYLGYEARYGMTMSYNTVPVPYYVYGDNIFFTHAREAAIDGLSSPHSDRDYTAAGLFNELTEATAGTVTNRLDQNLSYIKHFLELAPLSQTTAGPLPLANPRDWFVGAYAYLQLAVENPLYFRRVTPGAGLDLITARGQELTNFFRSLTFTGPNINWPLYTALTNYYSDKLSTFAASVANAEHTYATDPIRNDNFALNNWRRWSGDAPRLMSSATEVQSQDERFLSLAPRDLTKVSAGESHSLGLRANGTVAAWGNNYDGQCNVPTGLSNVVTIAAGQYHSLALRKDGTVVGWGDNFSGQATAPIGLSNIVAIAAGMYHSLALKSDGNVVVWGGGSGTNLPPAWVYTPLGLSGFNEDLVANGSYTTARATTTTRFDGDQGAFVFYEHYFFSSINQQLGMKGLPAGGLFASSGNSSVNYQLAPYASANALLLRHAQDTYAGGATDGTLTLAVPGKFSHILVLGTSSEGDTTVRYTLNFSDGTTNGGTFVLSDWYSGSGVALSGFGRVSRGGTGSPQDTFEDPGSTTPALYERTITLAPMDQERRLVSVTLSHAGYLGPRAAIMAITGCRITLLTLTNMVAIAASDENSFAIKADGTVAAWGNNSSGQTDVPPGLSGVVSVASDDMLGFAYCLALKSNGTVVAWGSGSATNVPTGLNGVAAIAAGGAHALALRTNGTVVAWGSNFYGQTNVPVSAQSGVVAIAAGYYYSLAVKADGTAVAWGDNVNAQCVLPTVPPGIIAIAQGEYHSLGLQADGTLLAWGDNYDGQCNIPAGLSGVKAIAAGSEHSLALLTGGEVKAWGSNTAGQTNVPAAAQSGVIEVAAGSDHCLALKEDGEVVAWGYNAYRQTNVPATAKSGVVAIAGGVDYSLALKADGSVVAWGDCYFGETNVPVTARSGVVAIAAGEFHCLALKTNGSVLAWGYGSYGQTNVPAAALSGVVAIAAGDDYSLALKADGTVVPWGSGADVPAGLSNVVAIAAGANSLFLTANTASANSSTPLLVSPFRMTSATASNGVATVAWDAVAGSRYRLQYKSSLGESVWTDVLPEVLAESPRATATHTGAASPQRFYRVIVTQAPALPTVSQQFVRARIPRRVGDLLVGCNGYLSQQVSLAGAQMRTSCTELSGTKALLMAVLELGMPYTVERDDVLHGFLYGSESLADIESTTSFLQAENAKLQAAPNAAPLLLSDVAILRYQRFAERLNARLIDLQRSGQPETPRLVGHTLRLLSLLRDAWYSVPPPALETWSESNSPRLVLYGEPYAHYTLQYRDSLTVPGWANTTVTNLHNEQIVIPPVSGSSKRFYRAMLPVP